MFVIKMSVIKIFCHENKHEYNLNYKNKKEQFLYNVEFFTAHRIYVLHFFTLNSTDCLYFCIYFTK